MTRAALLFLAVVAASGCSIIGEERMYYMKKDWERIKGPVWEDSAQHIDFHHVLPLSRRLEAENEKRICLHPNSQRRVVMQDGISDDYQYVRCPLAPYDTAGGARMGNRPHDVGTVVK